MNQQSLSIKLKDELVTSLAQSSSIDRKMWIEHIIKHKIQLIELIDLLQSDYKTAIKFSWMIGSLCELEPSIIYPLISIIYKNREAINLPNFDRTIAKMFYLVEIPEELEGEAVDIMFDWLLDPKIIVSTKNYSLFALHK